MLETTLAFTEWFTEFNALLLLICANVCLCAKKDIIITIKTFYKNIINLTCYTMFFESNVKCITTTWDSFTKDYFVLYGGSEETAI